MLFCLFYCAHLLLFTLFRIFHISVKSYIELKNNNNNNKWYKITNKKNRLVFLSVYQYFYKLSCLVNGAVTS